MAQTHVMFTDVDSLIDNFINNELPYFIVIDSRNEILWKNDFEEDINAAAEKLRKNISSINEQSRAIFTIRQFSEVPNGGLKNKTESEASCTFKPKPFAEDRPYYQPKENPNELLYQTIYDLKSEVHSLRSKIELLEEEEDANIGNQMEPAPMNPIIGALLENPIVNQILAGIAAQFFPMNDKTNKPMLSGIEPESDQNSASENIEGKTENERLQIAINTLFSKGLKLKHIEALAAMPKVKIQTLLTML